jgi:hypothetical protein
LSAFIYLSTDFSVKFSSSNEPLGNEHSELLMIYEKIRRINNSRDKLSAQQGI